LTLIGEVTDDFSYRNISLAKIFTTLPQAWFISFFLIINWFYSK
jgi:hypothetical protein